ncbi:NAD-dependent epimerase/dehydratase family protein [Streptococcus gordonii]|jgi:NAD-dependent epimerase/dehydratase|uniref:NAD-dependent epimerase/dehydratase family protein n=1 Tax=Streptococcus gordonii TaxID=1302 RepID=UPI000779EF89|nr:NAD(P)-dependent oxidoreductase [Streptococcus gordonii]RSJ99690.1 3 beta-hydroxysteroid dehydrogenase/Delta 5-->4-isomerase [Streptococcus gordonii]VTT23654.1 dihydroflavonol-4-reductase [Streptococcus gordonii]
MYTLITGSTGFIGRNLVLKLKQEGRQIKCLVRESSDISNLINIGVEFIYGDILSPSTYADAIADVDTVYHLAGNARPNNFSKLKDYEVNIEGTRGLLENIRRYSPSIKKIVIVSSIAATGPSRDGKPLNELSPMRPITTYGESKKIVEEISRDYYIRFKLPITVVRPPMVYGIGDKDWISFFELIRDASVQNKKLFLPGKRKNKMDFCYVSNLVDGLIAVEVSKDTVGKVYFISDNQSYSMNEIIDAVCAAYDISKPTKYVSYPFSVFLATILDFLSKIFQREMPIGKREINWMTKDYWICDISRVREDTNYSSSISLNEGVKKTIESLVNYDKNL